MNNGVAKTCKITAVILLILAFIGAIIIGKVYGSYGGFDFSITLILWLSSFISCLLLYAVGEIIDQISMSNTNTYMLYQVISKMQSKDEKDTIHNPTPAASVKSMPYVNTASHGEWVCKKCNTKNDANVISCKNCGIYK